MDFEDRLRKAIDRGTERKQQQDIKDRAQALSEEELKRRHAQHRRELSEYIESCLQRLADHFPGFQVETILGERGWGAGISRDDFGINTRGQRDNNYSRLELAIRPFASYHVLDLAGKGTVRNKEIFNRNHFERIADAHTDLFREMIDAWVLEFAERFAASHG